MGVLKTLVIGRPDGLRSRMRSMFGGGASSSGGARSSAAPRPGSSSSGTPSSPSYDPAEKSLGLRHEPPRDVTPPDGYEVILHKDALDPGRIIEIIIGGTAIAVANVDGTYFAISNACAHAEGPLGEGSMNGHIVTCPYHGWQYDVRDGGCKTTANIKVATYPVQVVGDAVCVRL